MPNNKIAVVGAGITGLTAAYILQKNGVSVDLFEKKDEPGGSIKTVADNGWQVEYGPNTLLLKDREIEDLFIDLGLHPDKKVAGRYSSNRFIVKNGVLEPLPDSFWAAIGTELFSFSGKLRVLKEPFISRATNTDETVENFVERRLGREILDYAINPFVAGIFANKPGNLAVRHSFPAMYRLEREYGSLLWGAVAGSSKRKKEGRIERQLVSFSDGLQQLPYKIASRIKQVHYGQEIVKMAREEGEWFLISKKRTFGPYKNVVLNVPLYMIGQSMVPIKMEDLDRLSQVYYPPLSVLHIGYKKEQVGHPLNGFGFLVPEVEQRSILGALFTSSLFDGRAPAGHHLLTVFVGGGRQPELASVSTSELTKLVQQELFDLIGAEGDPVYIDHVYWPKSIPAYTPDYDQVLEILNKVESQNPGLYLAGNFRGGISMPDCIKNGITLGNKLTQNS